jgi:hypothetical protein
MFGLLWEWSRKFWVPALSYCTVSGACQDGILGEADGIATWLTNGPTGWWYGKIRIGVSCFSRIGKSKITEFVVVVLPSGANRRTPT